MALALLRLLFAGALVFFIPGFLLTRALWPRAEEGAPGPVARGILAFVLSVSLTILVGFVLGFLPHEEGRQGWLQTSGTGLPIAETVLIVLSIVFFAVWKTRTTGWRRAKAPPSRD